MEKQNIENRRLEDDVLEEVSGGKTKIFNDTRYCPNCGVPHSVQSFGRRRVSLNNKWVEDALKFSCTGLKNNRNPYIFYELKDGGKTYYLDCNFDCIMVR